MTPAELQILQHALGLDQHGRPPRGCSPEGYRNHFCAGGKDEATCRALVAQGLMVQHATTDAFDYFNCSVTEAGREAVQRESPKPPPVSRSKARYLEFLNADKRDAVRGVVEGKTWENQGMIAFDIRLAPHGKLAPRPVKRGQHASLITHPKSRAYMDNFAAQAVQHAPAAPLQGPLAVRLVCTFQPPAAWPKWKAARMDEVPHDTKPDVDNLQKAALDALTKTGAFWRDDAQITRIAVEKRYGACPGTHVEIVELPELVKGAVALTAAETPDPAPTTNPAHPPGRPQDCAGGVGGQNVAGTTTNRKECPGGQGKADV